MRKLLAVGAVVPIVSLDTSYRNHQQYASANNLRACSWRHMCTSITAQTQHIYTYTHVRILTRGERVHDDHCADGGGRGADHAVVDHAQLLVVVDGLEVTLHLW